jgi:hypothetical protein
VSDRVGNAGCEREPSATPCDSHIDEEEPHKHLKCCDREFTGAAIDSFRYLRLAIVTVTFTLLVSIGLERAHATCWNGSISGYYYTPVHSVFVAALSVIGVALFAIRGAKFTEELLLNMAAFLAIVVAFVPTGWSSSFCPSNLKFESGTNIGDFFSQHNVLAPLSSNNLVALILGGVAGILLATGIALKRQHRWQPPKQIFIPAIGSTAIVLFGFFWYREWPAGFKTHAHGYAAALMFVLVGGVILSTALRHVGLYRWLYFGCLALMVLGGLGVFLAGHAVGKWRHEVLIVELFETAGFVAFWLFQTIELWNLGSDSNWKSSGPTSVARSN